MRLRQRCDFQDGPSEGLRVLRGRQGRCVRLEFYRGQMSCGTKSGCAPNEAGLRFDEVDKVARERVPAAADLDDLFAAEHEVHPLPLQA